MNTKALLRMDDNMVCNPLQVAAINIYYEDEAKLWQIDTVVAGGVGNTDCYDTEEEARERYEELVDAWNEALVHWVR